MTAAATLLALLLTSFLAATLLPGGSEVLLLALLVERRVEPGLLIVAATIGNTAGSMVNWACGRFLYAYRDARWFPVNPSATDRYARIFRRHGSWCLLFAWAPIVGDVFTVIAGTARVPIARFVILVGLGKLARYLVLAAGVTAF